MPLETPRFCQEKECSRLFSGRLCWSPAALACSSCAKAICFAHKRALPEGRLVCLSCAASAPGVTAAVEEEVATTRRAGTS